VTRYVALLRGVNVSGHRSIKMSELARLFEGLGFDSVQTYIQSGNVLFRTEEQDAGQLRTRIEDGILKVFGFSVPVVLRTSVELQTIVEKCPYAPDALSDGEQLYVSLLADEPSPEGIERLHAFKPTVDDYRLIGQEVYVLYRQSAHKSPLSNNFFERKLGVAATTRNWNTLNKLVALAGQS
jgi:uncharacterized protein (DUF1697 family)